ncbi:MAG: hypothetical protein J0M10_13705 [Chitinophagales bacterium]|nr:hypothetical protein [Chitinophagales bacterium]
MASAVTVNIKMYRVGELGDCFLLRFTSGQEKSHVLIDCGSFSNSKASAERMKEIATDIKKQIGNNRLNVIAGTHQHNDHLSGFVHASSVFESMPPDQVWLSWLDNPDDKKAREIGKDYNNYLRSLRLISQELHRPGFASNEVKNKLDGLMGFHGFSPQELSKKARTESLPPAVPAQARDILQRIGKKKPAYLSPGEVFPLPGLFGEPVKVYVLGPPKNEELLYDKEPGKGESFDPKLAANSTTAQRMLNAMQKISNPGKPDNEEAPFPFYEPFRESGNFKQVWDSYYSKKEAWRTIDLDWLNQAEQLALWLDGFTNNSSLVLAFELVQSNKVLLFAADAQAGNWNSWREIKWKKKPKDFNWLSLMHNTVLYKAGHHGSHNSTLVEGLDNMTHEELVVMIPVDKSDPHITKKNGWKMPAANLYKELKKRSKNRVIRMDDGFSKVKAWNELKGKPSGNSLYWQFEIKG